MNKNEGVPDYIINMKDDFDYVVWIGIYKNKNVYRCLYDDKDGDVHDTGLPFLLIDGDNGVEVVADETSFDIIDACNNRKKKFDIISKRCTPYSDEVMKDYFDYDFFL